MSLKIKIDTDKDKDKEIKQKSTVQLPYHHTFININAINNNLKIPNILRDFIM